MHRIPGLWLVGRPARLWAAVVVLAGLALGMADVSAASGTQATSTSKAGRFMFFTNPTMVGTGAIASGPDGALWFTNPGNNSIGRITTTGAVSNYTDPSISDPLRIVAGPDGALWFATGVTTPLVESPPAGS